LSFVDHRQFLSAFANANPWQAPQNFFWYDFNAITCQKPLFFVSNWIDNEPDVIGVRKKPSLSSTICATKKRSQIRMAVIPTDDKLISTDQLTRLTPD